LKEVNEGPIGQFVVILLWLWLGMSTDQIRIGFWNIRIRIWLYSDPKFNPNPIRWIAGESLDSIWVGLELDLIRSEIIPFATQYFYTPFLYSTYLPIRCCSIIYRM